MDLVELNNKINKFYWYHLENTRLNFNGDLDYKILVYALNAKRAYGHNRILIRPILGVGKPFYVNELNLSIALTPQINITYIDGKKYIVLSVNNLIYTINYFPEINVITEDTEELYLPKVIGG